MGSDNLVSLMDYTKIINYINNKDYLEKCDILETLEDNIDELTIEKAIIYFLNDSHYLVRCTACDVLYNSKSKAVCDVLIGHLKKEKSSVVRMHILSSLCGICKKMNLRKYCLSKKYYLKIKYMYEKERSKRVLIAYNSLIYIFTEELSYVIRNIEFLDDKNYHIRHNAINLLYETLNTSTCKIIYDAYIKRCKAEKANSVYSSLIRDINFIKETYSI